MRLAIRLLLHAAMLLLAVGWCGTASAQGRYAIDQRFGTIGFSVKHLGLFSWQGDFRRFTANLDIDPAHPEQTRIDVTIDAGSVDMPWQEAAAMLRAPAYFDVHDYPVIRFHSTGVTLAGPDRYAISGLLEIRGITRPLSLQAMLVGRHPGPDGKGDVAEFVVTGRLLRGEFGMTADRVFISDAVSLRIGAQIALDHPQHDG